MPPLPGRIVAHLNGSTTLVMATARDHQPWVASVFYAPAQDSAGIQLTCALLASSRKLANLRQNPLAALYIGPREPTCWLQAEGQVAIVDDEAGRAMALARLLTHAPAAETFISRAPVAPVVITLDRVRLTDLTGVQPPVLEWMRAGAAHRLS